MVPQNHEKVKKIVGNIIRKASGALSVPEQKFCVEMILGMLKTGGCNLTRIAGSLGEDIAVKHSLKRLQRMSQHDIILEAANARMLETASRRASEETIWALDAGDLVHQYGRSFELATTVRDGGSGELANGYWLNQISGYNPSTKEIFPVQLDIFSTKEDGYLSQNAENFGLLDRVIAQIGKKGLWVMDRGYDGGYMLEFVLRNELTFMIRMKETRNVLVNGKPENIHDVAEKVNRRVKWSSQARFGSKKVTLIIKRKEHKLTLLVLKDKRNKDIVVWLTPGWISSTKEMKRRIRGYFRRWGVEESYRFEKQGFGIEKSIVRNYKSIRTIIGLTLLSWLTLVKLNEQPKVAKAISKAARMEKEKGPKSRPKFNYYRLLLGVRNILAPVARLCSFRRKRPGREPQVSFPLFAPFLIRISPAVMEMEYAS